MTYIPHPFPDEARAELEEYQKAYEAEGLAWDNLQELREKKRAARKRLLKKLDALGYDDNESTENE